MCISTIGAQVIMDANQSSQLNQKVVELLDKLLSKPGWESTLLLRATYNKIKKMRDRVDQIGSSSASAVYGGQESNPSAKERFPDKPGFVRLYISLYQADGSDKAKWQNVLRALSTCSMGRPIYGAEEHVRNYIAKRPRKEREGYACVYVREDKILRTSSARSAQDGTGSPLVTLTVDALQKVEVVEFIHANATRYRLESGRLVLTDKAHV